MLSLPPPGVQPVSDFSTMSHTWKEQEEVIHTEIQPDGA